MRNEPASLAHTFLLLAGFFRGIGENMEVAKILNAGVSAAYNVDIAKQYGINEAIVLNKLVFLHQFNKRDDGFTWYTTKDWEEHTALSYYQVRKALEHLADEGIIEIKNTYIQGTTIKAKHHKFILETSQSGSEETSVPIGSLETSQSGSEETSVPIGSLETSQSGSEETSVPIGNNANSIEHSIETGEKVFSPKPKKKTDRKDDEISKLYYQVIKALSLPVTNHNVIWKKIAEMRKTYPEEISIAYLTFMRDHYKNWQPQYKPQVNNALDVYAKSNQIMNRIKEDATASEVF